MKKTALVVCALFAALSGYCAGIDTDTVLNAMSKEMQRSAAKLKNAEKTPLYYLSYEVTDEDSYSLAGKVGALEKDEQEKSRWLDITARVGSPALDNTHQMKGKSGWGDEGRWDSRVALPVDNDGDALGVSFWRWTDDAYKKALERYTKVIANKAVTSEEDDKSDDFSKEDAPETYYEAAELPAIDKDAWRAKVKKYSAKFKGYPFIYDSAVMLNVKVDNRYFTSSEGSRIRTADRYVRLTYYITSRTADGLDLRRYNSYDGFTLEDLPDDAKVMADMQASIAELQALKDAPLIEPYSGPAILKNRASGVYFHEIFGHRMEGHRQKDESGGQTFAKKLNEQVVSDIISVSDDPTLERFNGTALRGYYKYDNEGVKAQKVQLIEKGTLKNFLMNRSPIKNFPKSNGHGRRSPGFDTVARMGNTIVTAENPMPYPELRQKLIDEIKRQNKPYGLVFEDISGGYTNTSHFGAQSFKVLPLLVYKVYPDGRQDEVVRGVDIVGTPLTSFTKIIAAGNDPDIFNGTCGAESGWVPVSSISPSILISEMEVEKKFKMQEKPPVLPPPYEGGK